MVTRAAPAQHSDARGAGKRSSERWCHHSSALGQRTALPKALEGSQLCLDTGAIPSSLWVTFSSPVRLLQLPQDFTTRTKYVRWMICSSEPLSQPTCGSAVIHPATCHLSQSINQSIICHLPILSSMYSIICLYLSVSACHLSSSFPLLTMNSHVRGSCLSLRCMSADGIHT